MEFNNDALNELYEAAADKIIDKMRTVRNDVKNFERNWIWELIQNAKDNVIADDPDQKVSIKIQLTDNRLKFSHNYGYFTRSNVEGIVRQVNKKDEKQDNTNKGRPIIIGRFGTGFMTTHLLSKVIDIQAVYCKDNSFSKYIEFPVDRSNIEKSALVESIRNSFNVAHSSLAQAESCLKDQIDFSGFNTSFSYHLVDENSIQIAEAGINDLCNTLPYTLVFVDAIEKVVIEKHGESITFLKSEKDPFLENINVVEIKKIYASREDEILNFIFLKEKVKRIYKGEDVEVDVRIATPIEIKDGIVSMISPEPNVPFVFIDFPLIGTEKFYFPVILNFPLFEPTEARDLVYLEEKGEESISNQEIFKTGIGLVKKLIDYAVLNNWMNLYHLAKSHLPEERKGFSQNWFKLNIQKELRTHLLGARIVETTTDRILLSEALFPYGPKTKIIELWDLAKELHLDKFPQKEHLLHWHNIIDSTWDKDLQYDLKKMITEIASLKKVSDIAAKINKTEGATIEWLNKVIAYTHSESEKLLSDFAIIPNQYGDFRKKEEVWGDENIPVELKDVLKTLQKDWRLNLQNKQIDSFKPAVSKTIDDIVTEINAIIKVDSTSVPIKTAILDLLSCSVKDEEIALKRQSYWKFAKEFYPTTPDQKNIESWNDLLWDEADKWFIKNLVYEISLKKNLQSLTDLIKNNTLAWLHDLIAFMVEQKHDTHLVTYSILPDQNGDFKKKVELSVDDNIDDELKDILEGLGGECRSKLLSTEIFLDIEGRKLSDKEIASQITEKVNQIYKYDLGRGREEDTKAIFQKLYTWLYYNSEVAKIIFGDLYDKRSLILRTEEENIIDIEFKQKILANPNGYTENEIIHLVNIPKEKLRIITDDDLEQLIQNRINEINDAKSINSQSEDPSSLLLRLCITSKEELEKAQIKFADTNIGESLRHISTTTDYSYVHDIIRRAKDNVKRYLAQKSNYNISGWREESLTVVAGIFKDNRSIKLVIRPSDGGQIIIWYQEEFNTLEQTDLFTELWYDNGNEQGIYSFGRLLKKAGINRIPM